MIQASTDPVFPPGTTIDGSFTLEVELGRSSRELSRNLFDPTQADESVPEFEVPAGAGNSVSPNNVVVTAAGTEFATTLKPATEAETRVAVDVTPAGLVTYSVPVDEFCSWIWRFFWRKGATSLTDKLGIWRLHAGSCVQHLPRTFSERF